MGIDITYERATNQIVTEIREMVSSGAGDFEIYDKIVDIILPFAYDYKSAKRDISPEHQHLYEESD